jgi:hypothetical protein
MKTPKTRTCDSLPVLARSFATPLQAAGSIPRHGSEFIEDTNDYLFTVELGGVKYFARAKDESSDCYSKEIGKGRESGYLPPVFWIERSCDAR